MSYKLSKLDVTGVVIAVGALVVHKSMTAGLGSYQIGEVVGGLVVALLLGFVFAAFIYRISQQNQTAASVCFLLVLALMVLSSIAMNRDLERKQAWEQNEKNMEDIQGFVDEYKSREVGSPEELQGDYQEFTDKMQSKIGQMADTASGDEKRVFEILNQYLGETKVSVQAWQASFAEAQQERLFDFSTLTSDAEYAYRIGVAQKYREESANYRKVFTGSVDRFKRMVEPVKNSRVAIGAVKGMERKHYEQRPIFLKLMDAHQVYGEKIESLMVLLRDNRNQWSYSAANQQVVFNNDELVEQFNQLLAEMVECEDSINHYTPKLLETM